MSPMLFLIRPCRDSHSQVTFCSEMLYVQFSLNEVSFGSRNMPAFSLIAKVGKAQLEAQTPACSNSAIAEVAWRFNSLF